MYVSITRLKLKSIWLLFRFANLSNQIADQAKKSPGNLNVKLSNRWFKYFFTITHWNSKESMQDFMINGYHKFAMKQWHDYASEVKVYGFETQDPPKKREARLMVENMGRLIS